MKYPSVMLADDWFERLKVVPLEPTWADDDEPMYTMPIPPYRLYPHRVAVKYGLVVEQKDVTLPLGRDVDRAVAEWMGDDLRVKVPYYSTSIDAAVKAWVELARRGCFLFVAPSHDGRWRCNVPGEPDATFCDTLAEAICRMVLLRGPRKCVDRGSLGRTGRED